jgi:hypothetical protein
MSGKRLTRNVKQRPFCALPNDGLFDDRLETDPRFGRGIELARQSLREGRGIKLEDIDTEN